MKDSIRQQLIQLRPAMRPLAVLCALLALWLGWSGVAQFRDGDRRSDLEATRDSGVRLVHQALSRAPAVDLAPLLSQLAGAQRRQNRLLALLVVLLAGVLLIKVL